MQINGINETKNKYKNIADCIRQIYIKEGICGFYRGLYINSIKSNIGNINSEIETIKSSIGNTNAAMEAEENLDYQRAIDLFDQVGLSSEAKRIRTKMQKEGKVKVSQKVVHGDEVTKTEIKDSVVSKSSIGGGSSKMQELKDLTEMKEKGLIDDDEFKQMKKEILGK